MPAIPEVMYMIFRNVATVLVYTRHRVTLCCVGSTYCTYIHIALFSTGFHIAASKTLPRNNAGWLETKRVNLTPSHED